MPNGLDSELGHTAHDLTVGKSSCAEEILSAQVSSPLEDHGEPQSLGNDREAERFNIITQGTDFQAAHGLSLTTPNPFAGGLDSPAVVPDTEPCTNATLEDV